MRISKYLASCGVGARRKCEELVTNGQVLVNDKIVNTLAFQVSPDDKVFVNGNVCIPKKKVYYMLNKPTGVTTTTSDPYAKKVITDLVPAEPPVWPVGRLDKDTSGLIFLTNDGDFTQLLTHPSYQKEKEYVATLDTELTDAQMSAITNGILLEDGKVAADKLEKLGPKKYMIVVHEGRNRLVRRIFEHFGKEVLTLERTRISFVTLGKLKVGEHRGLTVTEVEELKNA